VSEEKWFAVGVDDDGEVYGDRDFRPIADCATLDEARLAALQAGVDVRGRIYIDEMVRGERGAMGNPIFVGYKSELQAGLRIPVQSAVSSITSARQAG
jgi:2-hydroxychromene-2-carboxylate isomerase